MVYRCPCHGGVKASRDEIDKEQFILAEFQVFKFDIVFPHHGLSENFSGRTDGPKYLFYLVGYEAVRILVGCEAGDSADTFAGMLVTLTEPDVCIALCHLFQKCREAFTVQPVIRVKQGEVGAAGFRHADIPDRKSTRLISSHVST